MVCANMKYYEPLTVQSASKVWVTLAVRSGMVDGSLDEDISWAIFESARHSKNKAEWSSDWPRSLWCAKNDKFDKWTFS